MFCANCGTKIEEGIKFCHQCGNKNDILQKEAVLNVAQIQKSISTEELLYYNSDWIKAKYFAVSSLPHLDILVTKNYFYLIQFPKTHGGTLGLVLGLLLFNILGAAIGAAIGNSSDRKNRQKYRITWLNDNKLISTNYNNFAFIKIPKEKLKKHLSFAKNKLIVITDGERTIKLKKTKKEFAQFYQFIKSYVL
ncbi:zinc ribbon domain-containing protein [Patescibacteria group bacterium]|nr:zinc ribbon domain-containing protein [Patescibacteria group bacterium]MCG2699937.1 zinc ribbon domain-containing protein [Candidatus Parcubacteria bacterium]